MRILRIAATAGALVTFAGSAASSQGTPMLWTIVGGLNISTLTGSLSDDPNASATLTNRYGFAAGVGTQFAFNHRVSLQPEVMYSVKGAEANGTFLIGGTTATAKLNTAINYIDIPVLLRYDIVTGSAGARTYLLAGPSVGIRVGQKSEITACSSANCQTSSSTSSSGLKGAEGDVTVGAGVDFRVGGRPIGVVMRYQLGLTTVSTDADTKNRTLQILATWTVR